MVDIAHPAADFVIDADRANVVEIKPMATDRRTVVGGGAALAIGLALATEAAAIPAEPSRLAVPPVRPVMRVSVEIGAPIEIGVAAGVRQRVIPITGGRFSGSGLAGIVLPGGADWQQVRADGTADILARYTLRIDDGTVVSLVNPGYRHGPPEVLARLARGQEVDPALYYFRTTPRFTVADGSPHAWLGKHVFVATAARFATRVDLDIYQLG